MTQEEKQLLLKDLCSRLPYGVIVNASYKDGDGWKNNDRKLLDVYQHDGQVYLDGVYTTIDNVKPYLRPLSSMTEKEFQNLKRYSGLIYYQLELQEFYDNSKCLEFYLSEIPSYVVILVFDWLNKNMFDYRGLISMGLALDVPEGMYND